MAGKRAGLVGERSGLFMEQIRIVKEMRDNDRQHGRPDYLCRPRYMVWENVPGAFSSNGGKDFQAVLTEIVRIAEPDAPDVPLPEKGKWPKAGCLYDELANWSVAWRTHDSQWWGAPQRRKRISVLADFSGLTAPEIMFDPKYRRTTEDGKPIETFSDIGTEPGQPVQPLSKGLPGDSESGGEERKETARSTGDGSTHAISFQERAGKPGGGKGILIQDEHVVDRDTAQNGFGIKENIAQTLNATDRHAVFYEGYQHQAYREAEKSGPLTAENSNHVRGDTPLVQQPIMVEMTSTKNTIIEDGISTTLTARMGTGGNQVNAVCVGNGQLNQMSMAEQANTLDTMHDQQAILCFQNTGQGWWNQSDVGATLRTPCGGDSTKANLVLSSEDGDIAETLDASYFKGHRTRNGKERTFVYVDNGRTNQATAVDCRNSTEGPVSGTLQNTSFKNLNSNSVCRQDNVVRRLTPLECERLQGYPDGWTDIGEWTDSKGKKHKDADSPRYKALGNSIALPFWFWLLRRISAQYERPATLGSLFDGISGFCLCWERCNGADSCRWVSEIEGFCIAVSTQHFGDEDKGIEGDVAKYL